MALVALLSVGSPDGARTQDDDALGTASLELSPSVLQLDTGALPMRLGGVDLPPFKRLRIELEYDADLAEVTALGLGALVAGGGASQEALVIREVGDGRLRFEIRPRSDGDASDSGGADEDSPEIAGSGSEGDDGGRDADASTAGLPRGTGEIAVITFAPLASAEEASEVVVTLAELTNADDSRVELATRGAQLTLDTEPEVEARDANLEQAEKMRDLMVPESRLDDIRRNLGTAYRGLSRRVLGDDGLGPTAAWLGIFFLACLVVAGGWHVGRQPPQAAGAGDDSSEAPPYGI